MSLNNIYFILVRPQMGENIGSVARAIKNFNIKHLRIVNPRCNWPNQKALATSVGAKDVLKSTKGDGYKAFSYMFKRNNPIKILTFLDEKTTLFEEIPILLSVNKIPFIRALINRLAEIIDRIIRRPD